MYIVYIINFRNVWSNDKEKVLKPFLSIIINKIWNNLESEWTRKWTRKILENKYMWYGLAKIHMYQEILAKIDITYKICEFTLLNTRYFIQSNKNKLDCSCWLVLLIYVFIWCQIIFVNLWVISFWYN